jgi:hypothetical protein
MGTSGVAGGLQQPTARLQGSPARVRAPLEEDLEEDKLDKRFPVSGFLRGVHAYSSPVSSARSGQLPPLRGSRAPHRPSPGPSSIPSSIIGPLTVHPRAPSPSPSIHSNSNRQIGTGSITRFKFLKTRRAIIRSRRAGTPHPNTVVAASPPPLSATPFRPS